jgi:hypothetical protein
VSTPFPPAPAPADTGAAFVVWDAAAYRRLAAAVGDDVSAARSRALEVADADARAGLAPAASPFTLWALLADLAPRAGDAGGRAHAALVACVAHTLAPVPVPTADTSGDAPANASDATDLTAGALPPLRLAPDPETTLAEAALGRTPPQHAAWNAYLASLAVDAAAALGGTPGGARRLAGPLTHVRERAAQQEADLEDEIQDAVLAAYEAGAGSGGWDDAGVDERQAAVAAGAEALARAVAAGRAARAAVLATHGGQQQQDDRDAGAGLFDPAVLTVAAGRVVAAFTPGVRLWAAIVGEVVAGRVQPGGRGWRGAVWGAQVAFAAGAAPRVARPSPRWSPGARSCVTPRAAPGSAR